MHNIADRVLSHEGWRRRYVNLIASENVTSEGVRDVLASDLGHRYSLDGSLVRDNFYMGTILTLLNS